MLDRDGLVVGIGVLDASLAPSGEPHEVAWPKSTGNHKHREFQVYQDMLVSGRVTVTIGDQEIMLPLEGATGFAADFTAFRNDPAATVDSQRFSGLDFSGNVGDMAVQLAMREEGGTAMTDVIVQTTDGMLMTLDDGSGTTFSGGRYAVDLALVPTGDGEGIDAGGATGGRINGSARVRPAEQFTFSEDLGAATIRIAVQTYTVSGSFTVTLDDGATRTFTMNDANAYAEQVTMRLVERAR